MFQRLFLWANVAVSLAQLRESLGNSAPQSDAELAELLDSLYVLANLAFDAARPKAVEPKFGDNKPDSRHLRNRRAQ